MGVVGRNLIANVPANGLAREDGRVGHESGRRKLLVTTGVREVVGTDRLQAVAVWVECARSRTGVGRGEIQHRVLGTQVR